MAALVTQTMPTVLRSSGRKQCDCCPYGYHIDLDFVRYCESISNSELEPRRCHTVDRRHGRKKRASMEVLLGIPTPPQIRPELMCGDGQAKASPHVGDALQRAVLDFEETLERSIQPPPLPTNYGWTQEEELDMKGEWLGGRMGGVWKRRSLRRVSPVQERHDNEERLTERDEKLPNHDIILHDSDGASIASNTSNMSAGALQNIREQMAASLERMRELEEQVKLIPVLQAQLSSVKLEKKDLEIKLRVREEEWAKINTLQEKQIETFNESSKIGDQEKVLSRSIGVGCNIITRDIGVNHNAPLLITTGTETNQQFLPLSNLETTFNGENLSLKSIINSKSKPNLKNIDISTDLKMDQVYCPEDLDRNIDKAIKMYEKTFHHLLHPKKAVTLSTAVQAGGKMNPLEVKDIGTQVKPSYCDLSIMAKPRNNDSTTQTYINVKEVGVSDHTVNETCPKCKISKCSIGLNFPEENRGISLASLGSRSKSFDYSQTTRKMQKSVGCGHEKSMSICKSTDTTDLSDKKDISVNTMKRKLVDAFVDACQIPCHKCSNQSTGTMKTTVSRIPRPTTLPVPPSNRTYARQDTYTKIHTEISERKLQNEEYASDSGSEDGTYYTREPNFNRNLDGVPLFQPIQAEAHQKSEPSKEMKAAMKVLNDSLQKSPNGNVQNQVKNAINIIQQEWFKVSSTASANPLDVEDYLDCFEEVSSSLLSYIVNMTDVTGNTAMHYAVSHGNFDVVSILLDSKVCNINRPNAAGYTCIMLVSLAQVRSETHRQVVRRLFHMADVNIRAKQHGQTALMLAVSHGRIDTVELLLESGADINIQDEDGSTALMCAAEHGHLDIVKLLLAQPDCDVTITDYDGSTALNIAMEAGNRDIGVLLYAQEHFSRGSSPHTSLKHRRAKSATPTLKTPPPRTPSSPHSSRIRQSDHSV